MKPAIKKKWVAALRSGKYKQGKDQLKTSEERFCCLGVLTDLYCKSTKKSWDQATKNNDKTLPYSVQVWAGIRDSNPSVKIEGASNSLSDINDSGDYSFKKIATLIEASL